MVAVIDAAFYVFHDGERTDFVRQCAEICERHGFHESHDPDWSAIAIAPRLTRKLSAEEFSAPNFGTLIFHPSALPHGRGPDAVRWAVHRGERVSAASWFWASDGLDEGDICEQEPVVLAPGESAGRAYHSRFCPAGLRALDRALRGFATARAWRRVPQEHALATYDRTMTEAAQ